MLNLRAFFDVGRALIFVGIVLLDASVVSWFREVAGWPLWLDLFLVGVLSVGAGVWTFSLIRRKTRRTFQAALSSATRPAQDYPWIALAASVLTGVWLARKMRPAEVLRGLEATQLTGEKSEPKTLSSSLAGELGSAIRVLGESALVSALSMAAKAVTEQFFSPAQPVKPESQRRESIATPKSDGRTPFDH